LAERVQSGSGTKSVIGAILSFGQRLPGSNLVRTHPPGCQGPGQRAAPASIGGRRSP